MAELQACEKIDTYLTYLLDGEALPEADRELVESHLATCEVCQAKLEALRRQDARVREVLQSELLPHPSVEELSALADDTGLDPTGRRRLLLHLERCPQCRSDLNRLRLLNTKWRARSKPETRRILLLLGAVVAHRRRVFATVLALAILGAGLWVAERVTRQPRLPEMATGEQAVQPSLPESLATSRPETARSGPRRLSWSQLKERFAERFKPTPYLEGMLAMETRGGNLAVLSPKVGSRQEGTVLFRWQGETEPLTLTILDNRGKPVLSVRPAGAEYVLRRKLPAGLYYWKLETEEELLYLGKFLYRP